MFACPLPVVACGGATYRYGTQDFSTERDALAAQQRDFESILAGVEPTRQKVGGTLHMYFVDQDMAPKVLVVGDAKSIYGDYVLKIRFNDTRAIRDIIQKRGIFDNVVLKYGKGEHFNPEPNDNAETDKVKKVAYFLDTLETLARADSPRR